VVERGGRRHHSGVVDERRALGPRTRCPTSRSTLTGRETTRKFDLLNYLSLTTFLLPACCLPSSNKARMMTRSSKNSLLSCAVLRKKVEPWTPGPIAGIAERRLRLLTKPERLDRPIGRQGVTVCFCFLTP
jgi:hypothetical protein